MLPGNDDPFQLSRVEERAAVEDGKLILTRTQHDLDKFLDENRDLADASPSMHGHARWRLAARIPAVQAEVWAAECGCAIGTPGFLEYAKKKLMDGDYARLRVKGF